MPNNTRGRRIQVVGPSCAGKSTLGALLAERLGVEFIELDAVFWKPGWVEPPAEEFAEKLKAHTGGEAWVVAGNYSRHTIPAYWDRLETVVWLDFPLRTTLPRILRRSWRRSTQNELLWGTNYERFWPQLKVWSLDSLIGYTVRRGKKTRERFLAAQADDAFAHIRWVRLTSPRKVEEWLREIPGEVATV
ncbi:MAG: shikimate kinase [Dehalococcoidia bacterium]